MEIKEFVQSIREGKVELTQPFFPVLIKTILLDLYNKIKLSSGQVPHIIYSSGNDIMWMDEKGYHNSIEPIEISNENYVYSRTPRCGVQLTSMDTLPDQLSNPYTTGHFQIEHDDQLYSLVAEMRRIPVTIGLNLTYILNNFVECMELCHQILAKLTYIQTCKFTYMGQIINVSYRIPEALSEEHQVDIDGNSTEKELKVSFDLTCESNMPVFEPRTVMNPVRIANGINTLYENGNEIDQRNSAAWKSARST